MIYYRYPLAPTLRLLFAVLLGRRRSFQTDAYALARGISALRVLGHAPACEPAGQGWLVTVNHYSRPGFRAWWIPIAIASVFPSEMHWVMTSTLTFPDPLRGHTFTPLSAWLLPRLARTYGFTAMPPMPPRAWEAAARARAVRQVLKYVRSRSSPVIGLAPEGGDSGNHLLTLPPSGAGRFIAHLAGAGLTILPVGAFEDAEAFCIRFGPPYNLPVNLPADPDARDAHVATLVMRAVADCMPPHLIPANLFT